MTLEQWIVAIGSSWYLAYAVVNTHGAFGMFEAVRKYLPLGGLTACIICLIFWIALVIVYLQTSRVLPLEALAVSGIALMLHSYTGWRMNI